MASFGGYFAETTVTLVDGSTVELDASSGNIFTLSAEGDRVIGAPTNPTDGQQIIIRFYAVGDDRTLVLDDGVGGFRFGSDITSLSETTQECTDYITAIYKQTDDVWDVIGYEKGYQSVLAIARDATSSGDVSSDTSLIFSHTCSGSNRILWVGIRVGSAYTEDWMDSVTYNGVAMTQAEKCLADNDTSGQALYLYYLSNPPSGTHDIEITITEATSITAGSSSYVGAASTGQPDSHNLITSSPIATIELDLTTVADNCWTIGMVDNSGSIITSTSPSTVVDLGNGTKLLDSDGPISPAGSTSLSASVSGDTAWTLIGASFKPL